MKMSNIVWVEGHFERTDEKKDEMKNRISMALKDPILQQGFELICKNLAELEKENTELKKETADLKERLLKVENAYEKKFEAEWRLNELYQKLRTDYANAEKCSREYFRRYIKRAEQLTKAKEIIRDLLSCLYSVEYDRVSDLEQAEQFLKE